MKFNLIFKKRLAVAALIAVAIIASACGSDEPASTSTPTATSQAQASSTAVNGTPTPDTSPTTVPSVSPTSVADPTATLSPTSTPTAIPSSTPAQAATSTPRPGARTVELVSSKDNTLYESQTGATSNGIGEGMFAGRTNSGAVRRALVMFDVASVIPEGSEIHSVELRLTVDRSMSTQQVIRVFRVEADWGEAGSNANANEGGGTPAVEGDATWTHRFTPDEEWSTPGGDFADTESAQIPVGGSGAYAWESTEQMVADVQAWVNDRTSNFGWLLMGPEGANRTTKRFATREDSIETARPTLFIEFTPSS